MLLKVNSQPVQDLPLDSVRDLIKGPVSLSPPMQSEVHKMQLSSCYWEDMDRPLHILMTRLEYLWVSIRVFAYIYIHSHVRRDSLIYVKWIVYTWHESFTECDMTHPYAYTWHGSFICVTGLIDTFDMTHLYAYTWRDASKCGRRIIDIWDMTHP